MSDQVTYHRQEFDFLGSLERNLRDLQGYDTLAYELIQNADDVKDCSGNPAAFRIIFDVRDDALVVENDGVFRDVDFERMTRLAGGSKRDEENTTGAFGIGFTVVYQITDSPEILSSGRHWTFVPVDDGKIVERDVETRGTIFRLPYAVDPNSATRQRLRQQAFDSSQLDEFQATLCRAVSHAALFLRQLTRLEIRRQGTLVHFVERDRQDGTLRLTENGVTSSWRRLDGSFDDEASKLRAEYPVVDKKKRSKIELAVPQDLLTDGLLYATLPANRIAGLPFHLNADFYPKSDRKQIIFDDVGYQSDWNREAIRAAAKTIARETDVLREHFGPKSFWGNIAQLQSLSRDAETGAIDHVFGEFWQHLRQDLATEPIVYTSTEKWVGIGDASLLQSKEELEVLEVFEALGIQVVHPDLREHQNLLLQFGVKRPSITEIVGKLHDAGIDRELPLAEAPAPLNTHQTLTRWWSALEKLLPAGTGEGYTNDEEQLRNCALFLNQHGHLVKAKDIYRGTSREGQLFWWRGWLAGGGAQGPSLPSRLVDLMTIPEAANAINQLNDADAAWKTGELDLIDLHRWFQERMPRFGESNIREARRIIGSLAIFPVGGMLKPLTEDLYLPTDFVDPLGRSNLIDLEALAGRRDLLLDLQVPVLTFENYVRAEIPRFFDDMESYGEELHWNVLKLLGDRLGSLRTSEALRQVLSRLNIVICHDDLIASPEEGIYFDLSVRQFLGPETLVALPPRTIAIREFYQWLGVAIEPRTQDLVDRVLQAQPDDTPFDHEVGIVTQALRLLANRELDDRQRKSLAEGRWLPARRRGSRVADNWFRPDELFAAFQAYVFEYSEALILDVDFPTQTTTAGLLQSLGVQRSPTFSLMADHLLVCMEREERPHPDVYRQLSLVVGTAANKSVLRKLQIAACLWIQDHFVKPSDVFWEEHPFGTYRYQLDRSSWSPHESLLKELGVRERPELSDFQAVFEEIAAEFEGAIVSDDARKVIFQSLRHLTDWMEEDGGIATEINTRLSGIASMPNDSGALRLPRELLFEDRPEIKSKFNDRVAANIIAKVEDVWPAMEAAGVSDLSTALQVTLVNRPKLVDDEALLKKIRERAPLLTRVLEQYISDDVSELVENVVNNLLVRSADNLIIRYELPDFDHAASEDESVQAVWLGDTNRLCYVPGDRSTMVHLARELGAALLPSMNIAAWIKVILDEPTPADANRQLDDFGLAPARQQVEWVELAGKPVLAPTEQVDEGGLSSELPDNRGDQGNASESSKGADDLHREQRGAAGNGNESKDDDGADDDVERRGSPATATRSEQRDRVSAAGGSATAQTPLLRDNLHRFGTPEALANRKDPDGAPQRPRQKRGKLRSYVIDEDDEVTKPLDPERARKRRATDRAGIEAVLEYERNQGCNPIEQHHENPGFDIQSIDKQNGSARFIEVKSLGGEWDESHPAALSKAQYDLARQKGQAYWLYVVEFARDERPRIHRIQDPAGRANQYLFDDGWQAVAEDEKRRGHQ